MACSCSRYNADNGLANTYLPSYISEIFTRKDASYNLRNNDFEIPRFNTIRYGKHTLRYQGPYIWSKLGNVLRKLPSLRPCPHVYGYFRIRNFFVADSKIYPSTRSVFKSYLPVHTYPMVSGFTLVPKAPLH